MRCEKSGRKSSNAVENGFIDLDAIQKSLISALYGHLIFVEFMKIARA